MRSCPGLELKRRQRRRRQLKLTQKKRGSTARELASTRAMTAGSELRKEQEELAVEKDENGVLVCQDEKNE